MYILMTYFNVIFPSPSKPSTWPERFSNKFCVNLFLPSKLRVQSILILVCLSTSYSTRQDSRHTQESARPSSNPLLCEFHWHFHPLITLTCMCSTTGLLTFICLQQLSFSMKGLQFNCINITFLY